MVEYASFLLYLNRNLDLDKLQRLQNRALRICFGIYDPKSISIDNLHKRAKMRKLAERCDLHLLNIMYDSQKCVNYIRKAAVCTRQADKVCFHTEQVHYDLYKWSPYYIGAGLWSKLPLETQSLGSKILFKAKTKLLMT